MLVNEGPWAVVIGSSETGKIMKEEKPGQTVEAVGREEADKLGVEFSMPSWIGSVPDAEQEAAIRRHVGDLLLKKKRYESNALNRALKKQGMADLVSGIDEAGYRVTFMSFVGYEIAIAYEAHGLPSPFKKLTKLDCFFSVCAVADVFSRQKARQLLLDRIHVDERRYAFCCAIPLECERVAEYVKGRFFERIENDSAGLPYDMVQAFMERLRGFRGL